MSHYLNCDYMTYKDLISIHLRDIKNKKILLIGAGEMATQYAHVLIKLKVCDVTVISKEKKKTLKFCKHFNFTPLYGGYKKHLPHLDKMDLVIIANPISLTVPATELGLKFGQDNFLIEKPGSLFYNDLISLSKKVKNQTIRVAYNRLVYPNFLKLKELVEKEGGVTSCRFIINERIHEIHPPKSLKIDTYERWGIYVSIHVISMVADLIGLPKKMTNIQMGNLKWHPSGSIFVGAGISEKDIPFSYHADWNFSGSWEIEIMTRKNTYRLKPLEELYLKKNGSNTWNLVPFDIPFPDLKQGVAEEIVIMLDRNLRKKIELPTLELGIKYNKFAEKIFGYNRY